MSDHIDNCHLCEHVKDYDKPWKFYKGMNPFKLLGHLINEKLKTNRENMCSYLAIVIAGKNKKISDLEGDNKALKEIIKAGGM